MTLRLHLSAFDSDHYALRIGVLGPGGDLDAAIASARRDGYDVVFVRLLDTDPWCGELERRGHRPVDTLVTSTLTDELAPAHPAIPVEHHATVTGADADAIVAITTATIHTSHLHADPRLPAARTQALYAAWIRNDLAGRAERTLVARDGGEVIGYLAALVRDDTAIIDLIAVRPDWHGRGVGSALIASFVDWVRERGLGATVGTQADNPALRLYARCGFAPTTTQLTYHLWLDA